MRLVGKAGRVERVTEHLVFIRMSDLSFELTKREVPEQCHRIGPVTVSYYPELDDLLIVTAGSFEAEDQ